MKLGSGAILIQCFGALRVNNGAGSPVVIANRKNQAILAILAVAPQFTQSRDAICDLLWPEKPLSQSRGALRQSLLVLRQELGSAANELLISRDTEIALNVSPSNCDVAEFQRLVRSGSPDDLRDAWALYAGPFFDNAQVSSGEFQQWHSLQRQRFHIMAVESLQALCGAAQGAEKRALALQLVELDPIREASHRLLMAAYLGMGETALAAKQYDVCSAFLRSEFGVEPSPETQALGQAIRRPFTAGDAAPVVHARAVNGAESQHGQLSLVVSPFRNLTAGADRQYLADGLTEDITADLSRFRNLFVLGSSTSYHSAQQGQGGLAVARELGVRFCVEGSVRQSAGSLRVAVRLTEVLTGREVWANRYDVGEETFQAAYDDVVGSIVGTLEGRLASAVVISSRRHPAPSYRAYERVLRARELLSSYRSREAEAELLAAVDMDANYAQAHAWLSLARWSVFNADLDEVALQNAVSDGARAVSLDPEDSVCHAHYGLALIFNRQFQMADVHTLRAIFLNAADTTALATRADYLSRCGQGPGAVDLLMLVRRRDPYPPGYFWESLAIAQLCCERYADALTSVAHMLQPKWWDHCYRVIAYEALSDHEKAASVAAEILAQRPGLTVSGIMRAEPHSNHEVTAKWATHLRAAGFPD